MIQTWIALVLWLGAVIGQILTGVFSGRLKRLEADVAHIREKASEEGNRRQLFVNEVEVRLSAMDERIKYLHQKGHS